IRLSGFNDGEIKIVFSGLRPGEKLYEELLADDEHTLPTPHPKLRIAQARQASGAWLDALLLELNRQGACDDRQTRDFVLRWVPEYTEFPATDAPDNLA
ncbi:MAG: polysaccharide biosynthesis protein, partial [Sulfuricellaceae bacterium]|nr:polysaccharide biosynthesis protein [Sulfuricellaceae bacterium]